MPSFGELLRQFRTAGGFSQGFLAERARLSREAVSALERGARRAPYRVTVALLADALGLSVEQRAELELAAAHGRARTARESPTPGEPRHNLALQLTSFVGRERELGDLTALLAKHRLVTVTGSGGIGKTRVALEVAARILPSRGDEIWFIDLSALSDGALTASKIASVMNIEFDARGEPAVELARSLRGRKLVLVLDNCEHVITHVADVARAILQTCPTVTIFATSRERIGIVGEATYRIASLPESTAVSLFTDRAVLVEPLFALTPERAEIAADICRRLDGIPLAIELTAAQLPMLGLQTLQARLEEHFNIPTGRRDLPPRQQTVIATIRWSYDLLAKEERELLCDVAVFSGGFTLDAAEVVCVHDAIDRSSILPILSSLIDKSLVNVEHLREGVRYALLDSVRSFGLDRLREAGNETCAFRRHAQWLAAIADDIDRKYAQTPPEISEALLPEFDNVRGAIAWSLDASSHDDRALAGKIITHLDGLWVVTGRRQERRRWIEFALERIDETNHPLVVAHLLLDFIVSGAYYEKAALAAIDRAIPLFDRVGDWRASVRLHSMLTSVLAENGKFAEAEQSFERAFALLAAEEQNLNSMLRATLFVNRFTLDMLQRRFNDARADLANAEAIALSLGDRFFGICYCCPRLVQIEHAVGNTPRAVQIAEQMLDSEFGSNPLVAFQAVDALAALRLLLGEVSAAAESIRVLLGRMRPSQALSYPACDYAAAAAALRGHGLVAAKLTGFVAMQEQRTNSRRTVLREETHKLLRSLLDDQLSSDDIAAAGSEGARLTGDEAIAEALASLDLEPVPTGLR
jgi:predicted ATPase